MAVTAQQLLDAVNKALLALLMDGIGSVKVEDITYTANDVDKLKRLRNDLKLEVAQELSSSSGRDPMFVGAEFTPKTRFSRPS